MLQQAFDSTAVALQMLQDSMKHNSDVYNQNVWSTITAIMISTGWLLTSDKARAFLAEHRKVSFLGIASLGAIWVFHMLVLAWAVRESTRIGAALVEIGVSEPLFRHFAVPWNHALLSAGLDSVLFAFLAYLIIRLAPRGAEAGRV